MQSQSEIKIPGYYGSSIIADSGSDKDLNEVPKPGSSRFDIELWKKENEMPKDPEPKSNIEDESSEEKLRSRSSIEKSEHWGFPEEVIKGPEDWGFPGEKLRPKSVIEEPKDCGFAGEKLPSKSDIKKAEYLTSSKKESLPKPSEEEPEENAKKLMRPTVLQSIINFMSFIGGLLREFYNLIATLFKRDGGIHRD